MEYKYRFSVFTATYNRAYLLPNVYRCLVNQTFKDFEWVVVDDGSQDDTEKVIQNFIDENIISIKYVKKPNGGKHTAWRVATPLFEGKYEVGADDDDVFPENTLAIFNAYWENLEKREDYDQFWEIRARCAKEDGNIIGPLLPEAVFDSDFNTINYKYKFNFCEMQGCRKVSVLQKEAAVPEHFVLEEYASNFGEAIRWSRAARVYKTQFINEVVRVYQQSEESLTSRNNGRNRSVKKTYNGFITSLYVLNEQRDLMLKWSLKSYFMTLASIAYRSICLRKGAYRYIDNMIDRLFLTVIYIPMFVCYLIRK